MTPRLARLAALALALAACPRAPPPLPSPAPVQVAPPPPANAGPLVVEVEALLRAQDEAVWKAWTEGAPLDLARTYAGHEQLFTLDTLSSVERARAAASDPREIRALTHLKMYLTGEYLSRGLDEHTDAVANLESSMTFTADGKEVPYRELERLLSSEASTPRRRALYSAATSAVERLTRTLQRKDERLEDLLSELGYSSYEAFGAELRQVDLDGLGLLAEEVLDRTQATYLEVMERLAQEELSMSLAQLRRADLPRLVRGRGADPLFPKEALLPRAAATLRGLGIELGAMKNLTLDLSEGKKKNPRHLSLAPRVPGDVRLSMRPVGGARDQANLFHELGHCLHYGLVQEPRFELAKLGNLAVSEAFSFLFEDLVDDPVWLAEQAKLTGEPLEQYLFSAHAAKLYALRRAAGTLLYDIALKRHELGDARELHREILSRALGVSLSAEEGARYLVDAEELYESADDFRAWILAAQLEFQLKARFGEAWWRKAAAGTFLRRLWASGNSLSAEELAREAGEPGIRPDALLLRLTTALGGPSLAPAERDGGQDILKKAPELEGSEADGKAQPLPARADDRAWVPQPWRTPKQTVDAGVP